MEESSRRKQMNQWNETFAALLILYRISCFWFSNFGGELALKL